MLNQNQKSSEEVSTSKLFVEVEKVSAFMVELERLINECHSLDFEQCNREDLEAHSYWQEEQLETMLEGTKQMLHDVESERQGKYLQ